MLSLQKQDKVISDSTPNILPCRISHNGPTKVSKRYWAPTKHPDGTWASYFRGRKLCGKAVKVPEGYEGIIACKTDRVMPENRKPPIRFRNYPNDDTDEEEDDPEEQSEPVKVLEAVGKFDEVLVWKQDNLPATDDPFVKGAEEWIVFANAIHGRDDKPKKR